MCRKLSVVRRDGRGGNGAVVFMLLHASNTGLLFFTARLKVNAGEVSTKVIKERIKQWINQESPFSPITDKEMSERLAKLGSPICRRTVGKYRDQMKIPSAIRRLELNQIQ